MTGKNTTIYNNATAGSNTATGDVITFASNIQFPAPVIISALEFGIEWAQVALASQYPGANCLFVFSRTIIYPFPTFSAPGTVSQADRIKIFKGVNEGYKRLHDLNIYVPQSVQIAPVQIIVAAQVPVADTIFSYIRIDWEFLDNRKVPKIES